MVHSQEFGPTITDDIGPCATRARRARLALIPVEHRPVHGR